jgi:hypothetical protein
MQEITARCRRYIEYPVRRQSANSLFECCLIGEQEEYDQMANENEQDPGTALTFEGMAISFAASCTTVCGTFP